MKGTLGMIFCLSWKNVQTQTALPCLGDRQDVLNTSGVPIFHYLDRMRRGYALVLMCLLCGISALKAQEPFECTGQFYISFTTPSTSSLVEAVIDPTSDQVEFLMINDNLQTFINAAGYRVTDNYIYAVEPLNHNLYRIDANGVAQDLGVLNLNRSHVYLAGDISPDGRYLVLIGTVGSSVDNRDAEIRLVDLSSPTYQVTTRAIAGVDVNMLDIAFDPTDGKLYGVDARENRLVLIDFQSGNVSVPFAATTVMDDAGSLFFDSFGDLYAYGGPPGNNGIQNTLYKVNKKTGEFTVLTSGTRAIATDGCSCPHTVELRKEVFPRVAIPCGLTKYVFTIANSSAAAQPKIAMHDTLPPGFRITQILHNPYGGTIRSGVGTGLLKIEDMDLLPGIDSIVIQVQVGDVPDGYYKNQAVLSGLPQALGNMVLSDDPTTIIKRDSTALYVQGYDNDVELNVALCKGDALMLNASPYGTTFLWQNGNSQPSLTVDRGGVYQVVAMTPCDTITVRYTVSESSVDAYFNPPSFDSRYGDTVLLAPQVSGSGDTLLYRWFVPEGDALPCSDCPQLLVTPYRDTEYNLLVENEDGCQDVASVLVRVDRTRRIFAPNVFTPNGDEINDEFFVRIRGVAAITKFSVFDRWGNTLYTAEVPMSGHPEVRWAGDNGRELMPPGVYVWVAEVRYSDGSKEVYSDDVTLVR